MPSAAGRAGGATPQLEELLRRKRLDDKVQFLGHRSDLPDLMAAADAFALSSLWEGLGCVNIEALALEVPIVASDLPPVREVVDGGSAGILFPPGGATDLARSLVRLRREPTLADSIRARGRQRFDQVGDFRGVHGRDHARGAPPRAFTQRAAQRGEAAFFRGCAGGFHDAAECNGNGDIPRQAPAGEGVASRGEERAADRESTRAPCP